MNAHEIPGYGTVLLAFHKIMITTIVEGETGVAEHYLDQKNSHKVKRLSLSLQCESTVGLN
jgi:energy-converting hydrogenase Eha subunit H